MLVQLNGVNKIYQEGKSNAFHALKDIVFSMKEHDMTAVMGASGSGKSTLLNLIGLIDQCSSGTYLFEGEDVSNCPAKKKSRLRNQKIGFVVQDFALISEQKVIQNVMLPLLFDSRYHLSQCKKRAYHQLELLGIQELAEQKVMQLSGGQKQRVAIARAMVNEPSLLIADEPTGALDSKTSSHIMQVLQELHQKGTAILVVTHDQKVADCCDHLFLMEDGRLREK